MRIAPLHFIAVISAACLIGVFLYIASAGSSEPTYNGRRLSQWLRILSGSSQVNASSDEAQDAIQRIGTNAIPDLLQLSRARNLLPSVRLFQDARESHNMAWWGFHILGTNGQLATKQLIELTRDNDPEIRMHALGCLNTIGAARNVPLADLVRLIHDPATNWSHASIRVTAATWIITFHPEAVEETRVYTVVPDVQILATNRAPF